MSADDLVDAYLKKAGVRLEMLSFLMEREAWSDVVREAQELVELCLKAALRLVSVDPPKVHDVSRALREFEGRFPEKFRVHVPRLCTVSFWLRRDRELAFYGSDEVIPTETYGKEEADKALEDARWVLEQCALLRLELGRERSSRAGS